MTELGRFDPDLEMFTEPVKEIDDNHVKFLKWLIDNKLLDPAVPTRQEIITNPIPRPYQSVEDSIASLSDKMQKHIANNGGL